MIASAYVQNGAKVYIASRKEKQLKEVSTFPSIVDICHDSTSITLRYARRAML